MPVPSLPFPHSGVVSDTHAHRHVLIPYAVMTDAMQTPLALPHADALLARLVPETRLEGEEDDLTCPHERMAAFWRGWADLAATRNASLPWAALAATSHPECAPECDTRASWAFLTPCFWQAGADQIRLNNPEDLQLQEDESRAFLEVLAPWFAEDGFHLQYEQPGRWLVAGEGLRGLQPASLERALLRDVRHWSPEAGQHRTLQRLHSEVQMLLYNHPLNDARIERGLPPVNAFWLHASGALPASKATVASPQPEVWDHLREPALLGHATVWREAWQTLDAGPMAGLLRHVENGGSATLALCGERQAQSFVTGARCIGRRIQSLFKPMRLQNLHEAL